MASCGLSMEFKTKVPPSFDYFTITKTRKPSHLQSNNQWIVKGITQLFNPALVLGLGFQ